MLLVLRQSWALMLGMLLLMLGNGLQGTLLGVRGSIESIQPSTLGLIMSAYYLGFLVGSWHSPKMLARVGHVRVFAALGSLASAAFILYAALVEPWAWFALRLIVGFCFAGIYVVAESWLNHSATNETRGQTLSLYLIVQMGGIVAGQLLLNVGDPAGYELFVLISVLVSVSFAPILLSTSPTPHHAAARSMPLGELLRVSPFASVAMLLLGGVFAALFAMSSVYATSQGLSVAETSAFITAIFLGGLLFQYPLGWLSDRIDRRLLIVIASAVAAVGASVAMLVDDNPQLLVVCAFLIGGMANPMYGLIVAYANDYLELDQMASAASGLLFLNGAGAVTGPVLVGQAMARFGNGAYFVLLAMLCAGIALWGLWRMTRRAHSVENQAPWVPVSSRTTAYATGIALEVAEEAMQEALEDADEDYEPRGRAALTQTEADR